MVQNELTNRKTSKEIAYVMWFTLGMLGGHRFYLGDIGYAIAMLCFSWLTLGIWTLVDVFYIEAKVDRLNEALEREIIEKVRRASYKRDF